MRHLLASLLVVLLVVGMYVPANAQSVLSWAPNWPDPTVALTGGIAVNAVTQRIYAPVSDPNGRYYVAVIDEATRAVTTIALPTWPDARVGTNRFTPLGNVCNLRACDDVAVNETTNRTYILGSDDTGGVYVAVMDGVTTAVLLVALPQWPDPAVGTNRFYPSGNLVVNAVSNRIYAPGSDSTGFHHLAVVDGETHATDLIAMPTWADPLVGTNRLGLNGGVAVDSTRNRIYVTGDDSTGHSYIGQVDGETGEVELIEMPIWPGCCSFRPHSIAVNSATNRILVADGIDAASVDGATREITFLDLPQVAFPWHTWHFRPQVLAVNATTNRLYMLDHRDMAVADLTTNSVRLSVQAPIRSFRTTTINTQTNRMYVVDDDVVAIDLGTSSVDTGEEVTVQADAASITFDTVTTAGTITVTPIADPATAGQVPGGFAISSLVAYEISPSVSLAFSGPVTTCFQVPAINDATEFAALRVLHMESGSLVDRTSSQDFATRTLCATTTSFSPFFIARTGSHLRALFDQSKAYRAGSTIPIRLQLLDDAGLNVSSPSLALTARQLTVTGSVTSLPVVDAGNANPDSDFRYDSALAGYIFNLSTKGLPSGRYVFSVWAGADRAFFYTVAFEVR